jgi:ATP-dependent Clp protease ATP-binding subunit ClpX
VPRADTKGGSNGHGGGGPRMIPPKPAPQVRADEGGGGGRRRSQVGATHSGGGGTPGALASVAALKTEMDRVVVGQDEAKTRLCIQVYKHYRRLDSREKAESKAREAESAAQARGPFAHDVRAIPGTAPFDAPALKGSVGGANAPGYQRLPGTTAEPAATDYRPDTWVPPPGPRAMDTYMRAVHASAATAAAAASEAAAMSTAPNAAVTADFESAKLPYDEEEDGLDADLSDVVLEKANILICGPTGSGKTHLIRALGKIVDVPVVTQDATGLTAAGYVGEDVDSCLLRLLDAADGDVQRAERGIVYIDEVDKLARYADSQRDVGGEGVQQALLKMVEGDMVTINKDKSSRDRRSEVVLDTSSILFIVGGAFVGLERIVQRRTRASSAGIGAPLAAKHKADDAEGLLEVRRRVAMDVTAADLVQYGLIPEFVGRFPVVAALQPLTSADLARILVEPRQALIKQYRKEFKECGTRLLVTPGACRTVAERAFKDNVGARGLRTIMECLLHTAHAQLPLPAGVDGVLLDRAAVEDYYAADALTREGLGARLVEGAPGELERMHAQAIAAEESALADANAEIDQAESEKSDEVDGRESPARKRAVA